MKFRISEVVFCIEMREKKRLSYICREVSVITDYQFNQVSNNIFIDYVTFLIYLFVQCCLA